MTIRNFWHASKACNITEGQERHGSPVVFKKCGWNSVEEMRKSLKERWGVRTTDIPNGVRIEDGGHYQEITLAK